jgi:gluconolactonase
MKLSIVTATCLAPLALLAGCNKPADPAQAPVAPAEQPAAQVSAGSVDRLDPALDQLIAPDAKIEKVASGFIFVEGPVWHKGELWFSDLRGNTLNRLTADGQVVKVLDQSGGLEKIPEGAYQGSNGAVTDKDGSLLLAQHGARRIVRLGADGKVTPAITGPEGKRFNSPNDMTWRPDGTLWISDPPYGLLGQDKDPAKEAPFNAIYRYANGKATPVITDLPRPNGIGFSPDGKVLYVSNSEPGMFVMRYDVAADGAVSGGRKLIEWQPEGGKMPVDVPDGLKVDTAGNIWASGPGGIRILTPEGKVLGQIKIPEVAANIAFGGPDMKTAYIMGSTSVYRMPVLVAGQKPLYP